jgi:sec-independent protein translocase protein TatB
MFGMGMGELIIIAVVALLALGPDRLPGAAKKIGKTIRDLRRQTTQLKRTIEEDSQLGDAMKEIKQALRDDPFSDTPKPRPKPKPKAKPKTETETENTAAAADTASGEVDTSAGGDDSAPAPEDTPQETFEDDTDDGEPAPAAESIPVEPRMINMSEFQKYVHMWGPQAAAEKYGTSLQEAEAAIDAVVDQAAASKRDADG